MNEKEVAEIRRRFKQDRNSITHMRGCYVNERREIISEFDHSFALCTQDDSEKILSVLKKTLSGTLGKNLIDLSFTTEQVINGQEHKLLMDLRGSALKDDAAVHALFEKITQTIDLESCYLILLVQDKYDVPSHSKDGAMQEDAAEVYSYILCSICPIKQLKPALGFRQNEFHGIAPDPIVSPPELGFLFPAFDDRSTNIYDALLYTRDISVSYQEFIDAVFGELKPVMPAAAQKETFQAMLGETLAEDCDLEVVQAVHDQLSQVIEEHKANRDPDPPVIGRDTVRQMLESCGVSGEHINAFDRKYTEEFGYDAELSPRNLVERKLNLSTPDVVIQVNPDRGDLVQTRIIDGKKYILIRADEGVEVNGVTVNIR